MDDALRIAFCVYRGNPHCGGQGVYTRALVNELTELGHNVTVFSGPPYPDLVDEQQLVRVPSLDLYRAEDPFRIPRLAEFRTSIDVAEFAIMCAAGFPEPSTFSRRVRRLLRNRRRDFDIVHDNQGLGRGLTKMIRSDGWPVLATLHHPITVDRTLDLAHATTARRRLAIRRWYGFVDMQIDVLRDVERVVTVSESSRRDVIEQMGIRPERLHVVPIGVDSEVFRPQPEIRRVPGRITTTASADVPMKGLAPLLEAVAKVRIDVPEAHLVVVGQPKSESTIPALIEHLGLTEVVTFVGGISTPGLVELYSQTEIACVPSLYEGFSLPAVEAMACGVPVLATTGGAVPEVVGVDGETGLLVPPGDPEALAVGLRRLFTDPALRDQIGRRGRERVIHRFTWRDTARATADHYRALLADRPGGRARPGSDHRSADPAADPC